MVTPNQRLKLTGAAILVFRVSKSLQAAPAAWPWRSAAEFGMLKPLLENGEQDPAAMEAIRRETADRLRAAHGDRSATIAAIERFLDFGDAGEYSPAELWDYFCISSPTIPSLAGYDALEEDRIIRIFSTCTHARYGGGEPLPPDWPWFEKNGPDV